MITDKEIDAVRFYEGDIRKRLENGQFSETESNEGFFGIPSAYRTMNCLMFDGIGNEMERMREAAGRLVPQVFLEAEKAVGVFCDIYRAMCKSTASKENTAEQFVYRTEREISVRELKKGHTVSFTSTSKENKPEEFLQKKAGLTLLDIVLPPGIPYLDFEELLGEGYYFKSQKEILLPPFLGIEMKQMELTETELQYRDTDDNPPCGKYQVLVKGALWEEVITDIGPEDVFASERCRQAAEVLGKLLKGEALEGSEVTAYCLWKKDVRDVIKKDFHKIYCSYFGEPGSGNGKQQPEGTDTRETKELHAGQREALLADVRQMRDKFDKKRKKYKKTIQRYHILLIAANTIPMACMALSFVERAEMFMKIAAVITSTVSILLSQMLQAEVYHIKLLQRSKTYLNLCDLVREMNYETVWDEENEKAYVLKYREIMKEDKDMSLNNIELQVQNVQKLYQGEINA